MRFQQLTHPEDLPEDIEYLRSMLAGEISRYTMEKRYVSKQGKPIWARVTSTLKRDEVSNEPLYFICAIEDISDRKQAERNLWRSRDDLEFAVKAAELGTFYCDYPLDKITWNNTCKDHFFLPHDADVDFGIFYSILHPSDREATRAAIERAMNAHVPYNVEYRTCGPNGQVRWINAVGRFFYKADGTPIRFDGITIDISRRKEAEQKLLSRIQQESLLHKIGKEIRGSLDPQAIQLAAVQELGTALAVDRCYFSLYDIEADSIWIGDDFRRDDLPSLAGEYRISDFKIDPESYYPEGRTLVMEDVHEDSWNFPQSLQEALQELRVRAAVGVPYFENGRLVATLTVAMAYEPRRWSDDDVAIIEAVATQTRTAVESARILAEQQARLKYEALVGRIGLAIRTASTPEEIQHQAATLIGEALGVDRSYYVVYNSDRDRAVCLYDYHRPHLEPLSGEYSLSEYEEFLSYLFADGTAVINDTEVDLPPNMAEVQRGFGQRALIAVPLFSDNDCVSALYVTMTEPRRWMAQEAALVEQVATLTRTALETVYIAQREHTIAERLQTALQPAIPSAVPGLSIAYHYKSALDEAEIGGDFADVFSTDKGCTILVVGDLAGKGLAAAAQLATVRNSLRYALYNSGSLAQAINTLSRTVAAHELLSGFATLFAGCYDAAARTLKYVNCGQEPGVLVRHQSNAVELLSPTGPVLGASEAAEYREQEVELQPGDVLAVFTDGLTEVGLTRIDMLGSDGLSSIIASHAGTSDPSALMAQTVADVNSFAQGIVRDDQCLIMAIVDR
jgi:serine phosphatase RsbU (regulator of sigma subunit)/PAS domain-containing protein